VNTFSYLDMMLRAEPTATLAKLTVILAVAGLSSLALRRSSAAVRHVVWLAGLISAASMMLLAPIVPGIAVPVARDVTTRSMVSPSPIEATVVAANAARPVRRATTTSDATTPTVASSAIVRDVPRTLSSFFNIGTLLALWAIGAALVFARAVVAHAVVARLVRRARVLTDADAALGSNRPGAHVRLLVSDRLATPITTRWRRPVIILPESAAQWTGERRRIVLVHELAHIVRGDYAAQGVATLALAVLWFHPLAWLAVARLKAEAEYAADDVVLSSGTTGVVYASHLLDLARAAMPMRLSAAVAVGVVRSSRVERRFVAILDDRRQRRGLGWRSIAASALMSAGIISPLAGLKTVARAMPSDISSRDGNRNATAVVQLPTPPITVPHTSTGIPPRTSSNARRDVDSTVEQTIAAVAGARLQLVLETGGGVKVHGWDSSRVRMRARLGGEDWRDVRLGLARDGRDARVTATFADGGTHSTELWFEIWAPRHTDIDLTSAGGSVDIDHVDGNFSGTTGGGTIRVHDASGQANISTGGGDIVVSDTHLTGTISTGWGTVRIDNNSGDLHGFSSGQPAAAWGERAKSSDFPSSAPPAWPIERETHEVSVTNSNGSCVAVSVGNVGSKLSYYLDGKPIVGTGPVSISKPGGSIHVAEAPEGATLSTGGGQIVVDSSNKSVVASTGGGDIELRATSGNVVASTGAGDVSIRVVGSRGAPHNINVCDGHGRVTLELPRDIDATFELETAYTDNHPDPTHIDSDVELTRTQTSEWDDRYGTPRKFVRAKGTVGAGGNLIRVSTVNGDIVVRRR
jgi:beta-lactamase regulating signal transducer with metallopeptidase domain